MRSKFRCRLAVLCRHPSEIHIGTKERCRCSAGDIFVSLVHIDKIAYFFEVANTYKGAAYFAWYCKGFVEYNTSRGFRGEATSSRSVRKES